MTAVRLRKSYLDDFAPAETPGRNIDVLSGWSAAPTRLPDITVDVGSSGVYVMAKGHMRAEQEEVDLGGRGTVTLPPAPSAASAAAAILERQNFVMQYPRSLLYIFIASLGLLATSLFLVGLTLVSPSGALIDASLLLMALGGALSYGCLAKAEEIEERELRTTAR